VALADLQQKIRDAVITGDTAPLATLFAGGTRALRRFDIHARHYEESLTAAVVGRFPATGWLIGSKRLEAAARAFVHASPPTAPCIAEYGAELPHFVACWPETARMAYVPAFAELDWHLGRLSVSVESAAIGADQLREIDPNRLADMVVRIQPGMHYQHARWAIDTLMKLYLTDTSPESWTIREEGVHLEVCGARGAFRFSRLTVGEFTFRACLATGATVGDAAAQALELDSTFDPGVAFLALADARLMVGVEMPDAGDRP